MCLIAVSWRASPDRPLIIAANRDEAHARPTAAAHWWPDASNVLAGRDLSSGGTWLGMDHTGRFAAVTNLIGDAPGPGRRSRGDLVASFLRGHTGAAAYAARVADTADAFGAFNLLVGDDQALWFVGTRSAPVALEPGAHALSNVEPGVDWPKVTAARDKLASLLALPAPDDALFELLAERRPPANGYDGRQVSPFQLDPIWGTRSSTVIVVDAARHVRFAERSFDSNGVPIGEKRYTFDAAAHRAPAKPV